MNSTLESMKGLSASLFGVLHEMASVSLHVSLNVRLHDSTAVLLHTAILYARIHRQTCTEWEPAFQ